jgi:hypothetical protein
MIVVSDTTPLNDLILTEEVLRQSEERHRELKLDQEQPRPEQKPSTGRKRRKKR